METVKATHTQTPWIQVGLHPATILGAGQKGNESFKLIPDHYAASIHPQECQARIEANAELIVRAVNSHAAMVEVLNKAVNDIQDVFNRLPQAVYESRQISDLVVVQSNLANALALARGEVAE